MRYVFGLPRSGSTLAYNLVRLLTGDPTEHTHSFVERADAVLPIVCTFRDFRDCAVSWWLTKDGGDYDKLWPRCELVKSFIPTLNRYRNEYPPDRLFFARYERWAMSLPYYAQEINQRLYLDLPRDYAALDAEQCGLDKMRARDGQPEWKIDGQVNDGRSKWREVVKPEDQERVTAFFEADLLAWGYEL